MHIYGSLGIISYMVIRLRAGQEITYIEYRFIVAHPISWRDKFLQIGYPRVNVRSLFAQRTHVVKTILGSSCLLAMFANMSGYHTCRTFKKNMKKINVYIYICMYHSIPSLWASIRLSSKCNGRYRATFWLLNGALLDIMQTQSFEQHSCLSPLDTFWII